MKTDNINFYRPIVSLVLNGDLSQKNIVRQIILIEKMGFGGVMPIPIFTGDSDKDNKFSFGIDHIHLKYLSPEYFQHYAFIVEECRRRGLLIWIWDDVFCPAGWAGGLIVDLYPHLSGRTLRQISRNQELPQGNIIAEDQDFTYIEIEEGAQGIRTDILNPETIQRFIELNYQPYYQHFKADFGKSIVGFFNDEPGTGGSITGIWNFNGQNIPTRTPWSKDLLPRFKHKFGYELTPRFIFGYADMTETAKKVREDFAIFIQDAFFDYYMTPLREWCQAHKIAYMGHLNNDERLHSSLISNGDLLRQLRGFDIPGVDSVFRDITAGKEACPGAIMPCVTLAYNSNYARFASSAARHNGHNLASSETGGVYGFGMTIADLKWAMDYQITRGITLFSPHAMGTSNKGFCFQNVCNTIGQGDPQQEFYPELMNHIALVTRTLAEGQVVFNNAVYNPICTLFRQECDGLNDYFDGLITYLSTQGATCDIVSLDEIKNSMKYQVLIIPVQCTLNAIERHHLEVRGQEMVVLAPDSCQLKNAIAYPDAHAMPLKRNEGIVSFSLNLYAKLPRKYISSLDTSDFAYLTFTHVRNNQEDDIFFILNESITQKYEGSLGLLGAGRNAVKVDSRTGEAYEIDLPVLTIAPGESVLLKVSSNKPVSARISTVTTSLCLKKTWEMVGASRKLWNGSKFYDQKVELEELPDLLDLGSFSGWIEYENNFTVRDTSINWRLEFASLLYAAQVWVNDRFVGNVAYAPYALDILGKYVQLGENTIRLKVFNTSADYLRSKEFEELANQVCDERDLSYNDRKVRSSYPNSPRWQNRYTIMAENWDNLRKGMGFRLRDTVFGSE